MRCKLLSDFDGVWTDQALEAESVRLYLVAEATRLAGISPDQASADFAAFEATVRSEPTRYGWAPDGRITAFVDEDPFCVPNSLATYLRDQTGDPRTRPYRDGILAGGFETLTSFADNCFHSGMRAFREQHPPALVPHAREVVDALHTREVEIVVVSNSPAEKIAGWFALAGVDAGVDDHHAVRVRGEAGKQTLGDSDEHLSTAGRDIYTDRPLYRDIIAAEDPDLVLGDVFSLDLALPHVLREAGLAQAPEQLVLRRHPHTPDWVRSLAEQGPIDHVVEDVAALVELCERVAR